MQLVVLHVSPESDVIAAITKFAQRENVCISVLSASGWVKNATVPLRLGVPYPHAPVPAASWMGSLGRQKLLSLTETVLTPPMAATLHAFSAWLASETGTNYAGEVVELMAAEGLVVVALAAHSDCYRVHQLPAAGVHRDESWLQSRFGLFASSSTGGSSGASSSRQQAQTQGIREPVRC